MPRSMTGFGRAVRDGERARVVVTVRSVNHRGLKVSSRMSGALVAAQAEVEALVRGKIERGAVHIEADLRLHGEGAGYVFHRARLRRYVEALTELGAEHGGEPRPLRLEVLAQLPGVIEEAAPGDVDVDTVVAEVRPALDEALAALVASREREGAVLAEDIRGRRRALGERLARVKQRIPLAQTAWLERARARFDRLGQQLGVAIEEQALLRELASFAERADVSEEIARLDAHLDALDRALDEDAPAGRRLDFLAQELLREANTLTSKSADTALVELALDIKVEADKIKEQVANLE
jgi:uncharacterized protein (TIGR00255 family)